MSFVNIFTTKNKYSIIYSDPPWEQQKGGLRKSRPKQQKTFDYPTMSIARIAQFHEAIFHKNTATKHNVFIWTIDKYLHETETMMKSLGYKLHARFIWDKLNGVAPAFTVRFTHEYLLWFYVPGLILMPLKEYRGKFTTVIREQATVHSRKPETAYKMLELMFGQECKRLELFARQKRYGWDYYGDDPNLWEGVNDNT